MDLKAMIADLLGINKNQISVRKYSQGSAKGQYNIFIKAGVDESDAKEAIRNVLPPETKFALYL